MERYLQAQLLKDLRKKMVFLTGPRQVGKTYLSKQIMSSFKKPVYLNYDNINDNRIIKKMLWPEDTDLIIFDEIHKMRGWKNFIKGVFDTRPEHQAILVTGSARFDTFRKTGDSLSGRYLSLRLNPLSPKEIISETISPYSAAESLIKFGGFPEPMISGLNFPEDDALIEASRWRNQYFTDLVREDIFDISRIEEVKTMRLLLDLLRGRVGAPLSFNNIAGDLQISPNTVKKYIGVLESLYTVFLIHPFNKNISRSLLQTPKMYFYDTGYVDGDAGIKLENVVALSLLKLTQYLFDVKGVRSELFYIRTKDKKEVDFAIAIDGTLKTIIEVKMSEAEVSPNLKYFADRFPAIEAIQLVHNLRQNEQAGRIKILRLGEWLAELEV
ncbi:MAG: ATP-binding protein [Ignavibacteriaceae bacterium]|nr:ATP-binding protein [Ignavibacteriaceae bacterium]